MPSLRHRRVLSREGVSCVSSEFRLPANYLKEARAMIDWQFELEYAQGTADSKEVREIIDLSERGILHRLAYTAPDGEDRNYLVPSSLYGIEGFARLIIDGIPVELTLLLDNRVEVYWPVGVHEHSKGR
jgi:hypothetical protein